MCVFAMHQVDALGRAVPQRAAVRLPELVSRDAAARLLHSRASGKPLKVRGYQLPATFAVTFKHGLGVGDALM